MKRIAIGLLSIGILVGVGLITRQILKDPISFEVYGLTTDAFALQNIKSILEVQEDRGDIELIHLPPIIVENDSLQITYELPLQDEQKESVIKESLFLEYLLERSSEKSIRYINARLTHFDQVNWEPLAQYAQAGSELESFEKQYQEGGITNLVEDRSAEINAITQTDSYQISENTPFVVLGEGVGLTQTTVLTPYQVEIFASKITLRGDINEPLVDGEELSWWKKLYTRSYQYNGVKEGYTDRDCNNDPLRYGAIADINTDFSRCVYTDAEEVQVTILSREVSDDELESLSQEQAQLRQIIQTNVKNTVFGDPDDLTESLTEKLNLSEDTQVVAQVSASISTHPVYNLLVEQDYTIEEDGIIYIRIP